MSVVMSEDSHDPHPTACPIASALEVIGDRWTLLLLRDLLLGEKRHFNDFLASEEGIASNILSERLRRLEAAGLVKRERDPRDMRHFNYVPTRKARGLLRVLLEIGVWGARHDEDATAMAQDLLSYEINRESFLRKRDAKLSLE